MTVNYTSNLRLGQPVTGTESGTWGDDVNNAVTSYLDIAIAGTLSLTSADFTAGALTLNNTSGTSSATNIGTSGQYMVIRVSSLATNSIITAPSSGSTPAISSKLYLIDNADATYTVTIKATGQTGYTVAKGTKAWVYYNGTDYVLASTNDITKLTGILPVANGGTGLSSGTSGGVLYYSASGTLASSAALAANAIVLGGGAGVTPATTTTGTGVVTAIGNNTNSASGLAVLNASGYLAVAQGGTNSNATPTAGGAGYGTGTAHAYTSAGSSGQPLLSGGTGAPSFGTLGTGAGGTGLTSFTANGLVYASSTSVLATDSSLTFNGSSFAVGASKFTVASASGDTVVAGTVYVNSSSSGALRVGTGAGSSYAVNIKNAGSGLEYTDGTITGIMGSMNGRLFFGTQSNHAVDIFINGGAYGFFNTSGWNGGVVGNASTATTLATSRTIWGQSFNGSANVSGALTGVTDITASGNGSFGGTLGVTGTTTLAAVSATTGAFSGMVTSNGWNATYTSAAGALSASKMLLQMENASTARSYVTGVDGSTRGVWEHYSAFATASPSLVFSASASAFAITPAVTMASTLTAGTGATFATSTAGASDSKITLSQATSNMVLQSNGQDGYINMHGTGTFNVRLGAGETTYLALSSSTFAITPAVTIGATSSAATLTLGGAIGNDAAYLKFISSNTQRNWEIATQAHATSGALEFTPSTASGGSTFTTPVFTLTTAGAAVTGTLSATGNGLFGSTTSGEKLTVNGAGRFTQSSASFGAGEPGALIDYVPGSHTVRIGFVAGTSGFTDGVLAFQDRDGSEAMRVSSGNLGLGVTPSAWDTIKPIEIGHAGNAFAGFNGATGIYVLAGARYESGWKYAISGSAVSRYDAGVGAHTWYTAPSGTAGSAISFTQAMTLENGGGLGVGLAPTSANAYFVSYGYKTAGSMGNCSGLFSDGANSTFRFGHASGVVILNTDSALVFQRGGTSPSESARFDTSGNLLVGTASGISSTRMHVDGGATRSAMFETSAGAGWDCILLSNTATSGDNLFVQFSTEAGRTVRGSISYNRAGGLVAYNTTSDYRSKDVLGDLDAGAIFDAITPRLVRMHGASMDIGSFVAHELQAVVPWAVTGEKDAEDDDGNPIMQQVNNASLIPLMAAEIKALRARVAALEH